MSSVESIWEGIQLFSLILKFVVIFELFRQPTNMTQNLVGRTWEEIFASFRLMVSDLFKDWSEYVWPCLNKNEQAWFESIRDDLAPDVSWVSTLTKLCTLLRRRSGQRVIVLIDEYEAPLNFAYSHDFFAVVRPSYPSL